MYLLNKALQFPPISEAIEEGLLAIGGDLQPERLLLAYRSGIFPWFSDDDPILWWSPDPRMVLFPSEIKISKSMKQLFRKKAFQVTYNTAFEEVIKQCAFINRPDQDATWITDEMIQAYIKLHKMGFATSVEVWKENELVGGLYGIDLGEVFCGESMFAKMSNASKYGFITFVEKLARENYKLIDCQVHTDHLESLGAREIPREEFQMYLKKNRERS